MTFTNWNMYDTAFTLLCVTNWLRLRVDMLAQTKIIKDMSVNEWRMWRCNTPRMWINAITYFCISGLGISRFQTMSILSNIFTVGLSYMFILYMFLLYRQVDIRHGSKYFYFKRATHETT